ncbi:MAG: hypothetical protein NTAFB05_07080 [Nitrobacter sp.]
MRYCWVWISFSVTTVTELANWPAGVTTPVGLTTAEADAPGAGALPAGACGEAERAARRDLAPGRWDGGGEFVVRSGGGAIWIGGSRSGEADCWAREGAFRPIAPKDARTVEVSSLLR